MVSAQIDKTTKTITIVGYTTSIDDQFRNKLREALEKEGFTGYTITYSTADGIAPDLPRGPAQIETKRLLEVEEIDLKNMELEENKYKAVEKKNWLGCPNDHWKRKKKF